MLRGIIEAVGSLLPLESYIAARSKRLEALLARAERTHDLTVDRPFGMEDLVDEGRIEDTIFFTQVELARLGRMTKALEATLPK